MGFGGRTISRQIECSAMGQKFYWKPLLAFWATDIPRVTEYENAPRRPNIGGPNLRQASLIGSID